MNFSYASLNCFEAFVDKLLFSYAKKKSAIYKLSK